MLLPLRVRRQKLSVVYAVGCAREHGVRTSRIFRTREKPLEWTPLDANPSSASPSAMRLPSTTASFFTAPTAKPATSYSPDE